VAPRRRVPAGTKRQIESEPAKVGTHHDINGYSAPQQTTIGTVCCLPGGYTSGSPKVQIQQPHPAR